MTSYAEVTGATRLLVVTPTLGSSPYLGAAIQSVRRTGLAVQHVVIAPQAALAGLTPLCAGCTLIAEQSRGGMYTAIDEAVVSAEPWEWFTYLNDDDLLCDGFANVARVHMSEHNENVVAYGDVRWIDASGATLGLMPVERDARHLAYAMKQCMAPLTQQGTLTSRTLYERLGGFGGKYRLASDFSFWVRALQAGAGFQYYPVEVAHWRIHSDQASMQSELARAEAREIASTLRLGASRARLKWERLRYGMLNFTRYVDRIRRTGSPRSHRVFQGQSQVGTRAPKS